MILSPTSGKSSILSISVGFVFVLVMRRYFLGTDAREQP
jgi:hypothetical protein